MNIQRIRTLFFLLLLSVTLTGQSDIDCYSAKNLPEEVNCHLDPGGSGRKIIIATLPFWHVNSSTLVTDGDLHAFNHSLERGLKALHDRYSNYAVNVPGHSLPSSDAQKLIAIYWDANLLHSEKQAKIIEDFMKPHGVDVLIWGQLSQIAGGPMHARLMAVSRPSKRSFTDSFQFATNDLYCENPAGNGEKVICDKALQRLEDSLEHDRWVRSKSNRL